MLEGVNNYYSDANDLQNVYGRIAGTPAINNVPMVNNIISGYIFDFSAHPSRNFQIYFHLNETYKIFIRTRNNQGFSNWKQIYPDYISESIYGYKGYIVFTNGLILQRGAYSTADGILNSKNLYTMNIVLPISFTSEDQDTWSKSCFLTFAGSSSDYSKIYSLSGTVRKSNIQVLSETNINETFYWFVIGY